jgi:putative MATE family efflux protein
MSDISIKQHKRMTGTPIPRLVASLAVPTTLSQLITVVYNTADTYFVSHISTSASAAVGVAFALQAIIQAFGFGISMGCSSLVSRRLGQKKDREAEEYASSAFFGAIVLGFILLVSGLSCLKPLMRLLGSTETILPYACDYSRIILIGAPIMCTSFVLNNILKAEGEANLSMIGLCAGGVINIALDPLFIFKLGMGISGAALATVISQLISLIILLAFFRSGRTIIKLRISSVSRKLSTYWELMRIGFPTICRQGMASVASALLNRGAALYGGDFADASVAAVTISNKIYMLVRSMMIGIGQGFQPVAGYNYGAGRYSRVKKAFWFSVLVGTVISTAAAAAIGFNAQAVMRWFRDDPKVVEIGSRALVYAAAVMPLMAYSTFVNQLYQCLGFSLAASVLASCRQGIFFIPIILFLPKLIGLEGVKAAQPASDLMTFLVSVPFRIAFFKRVLSRPDDPGEEPA